MSLQPVSARRAPSRRAAWGLLLLLPLLAGCGSKSISALKAQDSLAEAYRAAQAGTDDKEARKYADSAIALAPNDPVTYFGNLDPNAPQLGVAPVFAAVGDDAAVIDYMTRAIKQFPDDERGYQLLGESQRRQGRTADQKATAARLVAVLAKKLQKPGATNIEALTLAQAQAEFDAGDPATGAATYQKAIQAYNGSEPRNGLAYAYAVTNTHLPEALALAKEALDQAQKVTGLNDDAKAQGIAAVQDTLAWVQYRMGDTKGAEQNLLDAVGFDPRQPEMRFHLGSVYAAEGKTDAARAELGHAVLLCPGYADAEAALKGLK